MPKTVIVVEDDPFLKDFYKFVFSKIDCELLITEDGDLFFQKLNEVDVGLVIMDISLRNTYLEGEKVDGVDLSKLLKSDPLKSSIPVIIVSAYSSDKVNQNLFEESLADDYFTKPIKDLNYFLNRVKGFLEQTCPKIEY